MWGTEGPASPLCSPATGHFLCRHALAQLLPGTCCPALPSGLRQSRRRGSVPGGSGARALVPDLGTGSAPSSPSAPLLPGRTPHRGRLAGHRGAVPGPLRGRPHRSHVALIKAPPCGGRAGSPAGSACAAQVFGFSSRIPSPAWPVLCSRKCQTHKEPANGDGQGLPGSPGPPGRPAASPATSPGCPQGPARGRRRWSQPHWPLGHLLPMP